VLHEETAMNAVERALRAIKSDLEVHLLSVFSVGVAFVCLVTALLVVVNVQHVHDRWQQLGKLSVYLQNNVDESRVAELERVLRATEGISGVRFVSREAARRDLVNENHDETLAALPDDAFPASIEIDMAATTPLDVRERIADQLRPLPGVEGVETYAHWSSRMAKIFSGGVTAALALTLIVLGAVISVVSSTIRMALQKRHTEVEVLKLVGATDSYVRGPFIVEGAAQGACGALFALGIVGALYAFLRSTFETYLTALLGVRTSFLPWTMSAGLLVTGALLGAAAAYLSLRKHLVL
jgi:cell division transport system permease protein